MPHIDLPHSPGITALLMHFPETGDPMSAFTEALLRGPSSLTPAERELIATYTSYLNECRFCMRSHAATTRELFEPAKKSLVDEVRLNLDTAGVDDRMRALLRIAGKVQKSGGNVTAEDIRAAKDAGADDKAIHDTVLVAAAFCMFNRYVDGLATWTPDEDVVYDGIGVLLSTRGYVDAIPQKAKKAA